MDHAVLSIDVSQISSRVGSELLGSLTLREAFSTLSRPRRRGQENFVLMGKEVGVISLERSVADPIELFGPMVDALQSVETRVRFSLANAVFTDQHQASDELRQFLLICAARWARVRGITIVDGPTWLRKISKESPDPELFRAFPPAAGESFAVSDGRVGALRAWLRDLAPGTRVSFTDVHGISKGVTLDISGEGIMRRGDPGLEGGERLALAELACAQDREHRWGALEALMALRVRLSSLLADHVELICSTCRAHDQRVIPTGGDGVVFASGPEKELDALVAFHAGWLSTGLLSGVGSAIVSGDVCETLRRAEAALAVTKLCAGGPGTWGLLCRWDPPAMKEPVEYILSRASANPRILARVRRFNRTWPDLAQEIGLRRWVAEG
jgi:hypothetical protein